MNTADVVARLRLSGEQFGNDLRARFGDMERAAAATAAKVGGEFGRIGANVLRPAEFQAFAAAGKSAADRMVGAIDPLFAAQTRYNRSIAEANDLQRLGFLTAGNYQRVHAGLTRQLEQELAVTQRLGTSSGQRRAGMQQLSFQIGDVAQGLAAGTRASVIFAQQSGQVIQAIQQMSGEGNAFMRFLGGPWGIALSAAAVVMAPLIGKLFDTRTELQKASDELEENARKAELTKQAQAIYGQTLPGVTRNIRDQTAALEAQNRTMAENRQAALDMANRHLTTTQDRRRDLFTELTTANQELDRARRRQAEEGAGDIDGFYAAATERAVERVRDLQRQIGEANRAWAAAEREIQQALVPFATEQGRQRVDPERRINERYDLLIRSAQQRAVAERTVATELANQIELLERQRKAELDRERARQTAERARDRAANRDYSQTPFSEVRSRIIANEAPARVGGYNALAYNVPGGRNAAGVVAPQLLTSMTIGQILDFQQNVMRPLTRGRRGPGDVGSTGVGAYQFESGTLRQNAAQALGENYRNLPFSQDNQDRIAENLWNVVRGRPALLRNTWAAFSGRAGATGTGSGGDAASAAEQSAAATRSEQEARARILQDMEQSTAQAVEQARLGDLRAQGLDQQAETEERLGQVRQQAGERMEALERNVAQLRASAAQPTDIANAETAVAAQRQVTAGLEQQLALYEQQSAAFGQLVVQHRADGKVSEEELAAERALSEQKNQTLQRAEQIATTVADAQKVGEARVRTEAQLNATIDQGNHRREEARQLEQRAAEEQQRALEDMKQDMIRRGEDQVRELANLYGDLFRGQVGDIWDRFKDQGLEVIATLAAQWTLAQMSGQQFNMGGALNQMGGQGNSIAGLLGGLFGGGKGGGKGIVAGDEWWNIFGAGGGGGGGAGAMGGMGGVMSGISSAMPYAAAALAAFGILKQIGVFSSTKRGSATLGFDGGELGAGATRGNNSGYIAASSSAMDSVGGSLERIAEMLGGTVTGAGSLSLGQRDGNWRGDPTGRGITKTKKGAIDFGEDQEAAIRWAIGEALRDGVIGGISDAAKRILQSGKDLEKAIDKAAMIESLPKLLKARLDPVGAALDELQEKWAKQVATLKEAGASVEQMAQAQQLYKLELEDTVFKTASASASLKEFLDSLKMGSNSPYSLRQQEETARAALQPYLDKIAAGESINQDQYTTAAQQYLDIERQLYGSTEQFFAEVDRVMASTTAAISRLDSAVPIRTAVDPFVEATAGNTGTLVDQGGVIQQQNDTIIGLLTRIAGGQGSNDNFIGTGGGFTGQSYQ